MLLKTQLNNLFRSLAEEKIETRKQKEEEL